MLVLIIVVLLAIALAWAAATYLPPPVNWIVALIIIALAAVYLLSGVDLRTD